ncbi:hypothetical protein [Pantoea sp. At-9b]|uniref:hypothetical protein n=1 Tax=Pantoea sp. (strain At-9b) TaxID=592316 RepID=UPI0001B3F257|nr:hypothetical protein [Pantoea sp. At-9b]ADU70344.1 hypothetical protein Pat9b_3045 [Pantoea sp. At-9b]
MKRLPFFFAFFLPSPDWEAIRHVKMNAKTNNKASQPGGFFIGQLTGEPNEPR